MGGVAAASQPLAGSFDLLKNEEGQLANPSPELTGAKLTKIDQATRTKSL